MARANDLTTTDDPVAGCAKSLGLCDTALGKLEIVVKEQDRLIVELTKQRNDAFKENQQGNTPWYVWAVFGAAAATFVIRGVR